MATLRVRQPSYLTHEPDPQVAAEDAREHFLEQLSRHDWRDHLIVEEI